MTDLAQREDAQLIQIERLQRTVEQLKARAESQEDVVKAILETMKKGETLFELRCSRVLLDIFKGLTHNLEHSIEHAQEDFRLQEQGFDIVVIDGKTNKENPASILVRKTEKGYDYSPAADPENVMNENTAAFSMYFDRNPQIFGDETELLVNIKVLTRPPQAEEAKNG